LANLICSCFKTFDRSRKHPAKTFFQALRIVVNDEINCLVNGLKQAINLLKHKGRIAVISFHSIEDRIIKNTFKEFTTKKDLFNKSVPLTKIVNANFKLITKKPIVPSESEILFNPRSHSAKLRIMERI
jgi:16S rRNA (cytosine1402-N4)-methyltransferase